MFVPFVVRWYRNWIMASVGIFTFDPDHAMIFQKGNKLLVSMTRKVYYSYQYYLDILDGISLDADCIYQK